MGTARRGLVASNQRPRYFTLQAPEKPLPQQSPTAHDAPNHEASTDESAPKKRRVAKAHGDSPEGGVPGGEQSSRYEDDDDKSSFWLVNDRKYPKMCGLWCGTFDAPDNLGKHFRDAPYYPLLKNDLSQLSVGRSSLEECEAH